MKSAFFRPFLAIASAIGGLFSKPKTSSLPASAKNRGDRLAGERLRQLMESTVFNQSGRPGNIAIRIASRETNQRKRRQNTRRLIAAGAC